MSKKKTGEERTESTRAFNINTIVSAMAERKLPTDNYYDITELAKFVLSFELECKTEACPLVNACRKILKIQLPELFEAVQNTCPQPEVKEKKAYIQWLEGLSAKFGNELNVSKPNLDSKELKEIHLAIRNEGAEAIARIFSAPGLFD
jgi:hypothetical protein